MNLRFPLIRLCRRSKIYSAVRGWVGPGSPCSEPGTYRNSAILLETLFFFFTLNIKMYATQGCTQYFSQGWQHARTFQLYIIVKAFDE